MTTARWAIQWDDRVWTTAPIEALNGTGAQPVTVGHYALVAAVAGADDWEMCQPSMAPGVLATWISVLGISAGLWDDMDAAQADLALTPLATLAAALVDLTGEE